MDKTPSISSLIGALPRRGPGWFLSLQPSRRWRASSPPAHIGQWRLAVAGNMSAASFFTGDGAYDAATDFVLGNYGVDTANNSVWAVIDHNSSFGVVPEPSTCILFAIDALFLVVRRPRWN